MFPSQHCQRPSEKLFAARLRQRPPQTSTIITVVFMIVMPVFQAILQRNSNALTVGLLESGTGTWTTELLGLAAAVVGNEEGTVELGQGLLQQVLGVLIDEPIDLISHSSLFSAVFCPFGVENSYFWL